VEKYCSLL